MPHSRIPESAVLNVTAKLDEVSFRAESKNAIQGKMYFSRTSWNLYV